MPHKRTPPPTALEREQQRKVAEAARRSSARHAPKPPLRKSHDSFRRRLRTVGAKVDATNEGYEPAVGAFDGVLNLSADMGAFGTPRGTPDAAPQSTPRTASPLTPRAAALRAATSAGATAARFARHGSRAQTGWARWRRLREWLAGGNARRRVWFELIEAAGGKRLAQSAIGRRRRGGLDGGHFGLEPPQPREQRQYAPAEPARRQPMPDQEWLRLTRPAPSDLGGLSPLRQTSFARFLEGPPTHAPEAAAAGRPQSAEPTPLQVSPGRTAFVLPPRAPAFALPPLTVEQLSRRTAPPELHCGGTVLHDGMRFTPRAAA